MEPGSEVNFFIIDSIDSRVVRIEGDTGLFELPASWLPTGSQAGDVLRISLRADSGRAVLAMATDPAARAVREAGIYAIRSRLPVMPEGDVDL
jgi:hypothetical protein